MSTADLMLAILETLSELLRTVSALLCLLTSMAGSTSPRAPSRDRWGLLLARAIARHRWAMQALALKWARNMPKSLDTRDPTGLTVQGQSWGWREIRTEW